MNKGERGMKKIGFLIGMVFVIFVLAGCSTASQDISAQPAKDITVATPNPEEGSSLALQLALGTFKLEETELAITSERASELLPLWKAARSLGQSENVSEVEVNAVYNQIQEVLSAEQMGAIIAMQLSFEDMQSVGEEYGFELVRGTGFGFDNLSPELQATAQARRESGEFPMPGQGGGSGGGMGEGGGPGGGFFRSGDTEGFDLEARQTAIAKGGGVQRAQIGVNAALLEAVIQFLEAKLP
jgi:hypothetical protein